MVPQPRLLPPPTSQDHSGSTGDRPLTLPGVGGTNEVAPLPPPRPKSGHSRSSSLDNQLIDFSDHRTDSKFESSYHIDLISCINMDGWSLSS